MYRKELRYYFSTPIAYIVIGLYQLAISLFLWVIPGQWNIIDSGYAQVDGLFQLSPWLFMLLCPALTMRLLSEERQSGIWDLIRTKPISLTRIMLGKYFAAWTLVLIGLLPCFVHYFVVAYMAEPMGNLDSGAFIGSFLGLIMLSGTFMAIGLLCATFSKSQIAFNSTCISRLNQIAQSGTSLSLTRTQYVEMLFNPVERMLAVRPCAEDNPNAICWATENGRSRAVSASAFCRILFSIMDWDSEYTYRVPCIVRSKGEETILFFDLDNFIGTAKQNREENLEEEVAAAEEAIREESAETKGIFFSADEDEEPQEIEDTEEMERKLQELAEIERRTFGTPVFEHKGDVRLPSIDDDGEWDVMAMPRILGEDHRVDEEVIDALQDQLLESMIANETEGGTEWEV